MNAYKKDLKSGSVKICEYTREDFEKGTFLREVVGSIYDHLPEFKDNIIWIMKVIPNKNSTIKVVTNQFIKSLEGTDGNRLIMSQAGTLGLMPEMGDVKTALPIVNKERANLFKAGFGNLVWNRRMTGCYGNPDVFVYIDDYSSKWITDNTGDNDSKIINRLNA